MAYDLIKISALPAATPDESQEIVVGVGDLAKRINYGDVKADMVGTSPSYTTDTEPYLMRQTAHTGVVGKCALEKLVGGSLGWNQLAKELNSTNWVNENGTTASFTEGVATFTSTINNNGIVTQYSLSTFANHKYFLCMDVKSSTAYTGLSFGIPGSGQPMIRRTDSIGGDTAWHTIEGIRECTSSDNLKRTYVFRTNGTVENLSVRNVMCLDLTLMLGSTIADYVYNLETATAGSGIAWLSRYIDLGTYHAYDAGSIQSVQATAHVTKDANDNVIGNYPLGSDTLRGIPALVNNKLQFDGDEKYPDGTIKRKYGSRAYQSGDTSDGATMITDGTTTVYKLTTPTTESSTAFQKVQTIDADGTESFTTSTPVPVGHETQTPDNILAALNWLGE